MPHGNQSESECLLGGKIGKIGKIPGILRVYLEKPGYTRVIPALLHGNAPGTTPTAATNENPAYHFRVPLYHTTPKLIKISPNTGLIPVKIEHCPDRPLLGPVPQPRRAPTAGPCRGCLLPSATNTAPPRHHLQAVLCDGWDVQTPASWLLRPQTRELYGWS